MKYIRCVCLLLALAVLLAIPVFAAGSSVTLTSTAQALKPGDTFTVDVLLENSDAIALGTVALDYDEKIFTLVGGTCHVENAMLGEVLVNEKAGTFFLVLPRKLSGKIFSFQFRLNGNVSNGTYEIGAEASIGDANGADISVKSLRVQVGQTAVPEQGEKPVPPTTAPEPTAPPPQPPAQIPETRPAPGEEQTEVPPTVAPTESPVEGTTETPTVAPAVPPAAALPKEGGKPWWIVAVLLLGCVAVFVIWKKKR